MKQMVPHYYSRFKCIADRCRHSCCIGWEIDIDPQTRENYRCLEGSFGQRLNAAISDDGDTAHFRLLENEHCPMLNEKGLCDLICTLGEDHLCQICADHPRYRQFFSDYTEMGLGLCCEAAAEMALSETEPLHFIPLESGAPEINRSPEEEEFQSLRTQCLFLMQDRSVPLHERLEHILSFVEFPLPSLNWQEVYRRLEILDPDWQKILSLLPADLSCADFPPHLSVPLEQFGSYLLYRHLPNALEDDDFSGWAAFCVLSCRVLMALCAGKANCTFSDFAGWARMYSAEIEYSQSNLDDLLSALWQNPDFA